MVNPSPSLSNLPRNTLSIVLSYLQQLPRGETTSDNRAPHNRDAISLLLTNKRFAYAILPLFRLPKHLCTVHEYEITNDDGESKTVLQIEKYRFMKLPIQDPRTLLDRLNTRRLRLRIKYNKQQQVPSEYQNCYQFGRNMEELALEEWLMLQIHHRDDAEMNKQSHVWPAHLELLRFSDCTLFDGAADCNETKQKRVKFKKLLRLCSRHPKDLTAIEELDWLPQCNVFGDGITLLSSYPRSGNTLMRTLLERITSTITGSDTRPDRTLSIKLALEHDLVGEGLTGKDPCVRTKQKLNRSLSQKRKKYQTIYDPMVKVKTHFPERRGWRQVTGNRVILLVRNPYDAIDSYWNLCCTNTHTSSLDETVYTKYAAKFESMARHEIRVWCDFHYYWLDVCSKEDIPFMIVRYEDLILNTEKEMLRVLNFLNDTTDGHVDAFWEWRIRHATGKASIPKEKTSNPSACTASLGSYRPRSSGGGLSSIGKSLGKNRYSESVLCHMADVAASLALERKMAKKNAQTEQAHMTLLQRFGYDIVNQQFPSNFACPLPAVEVARHRSKNRSAAIQINSSPEIRDKDDPFGRAMTYWRRGETNGDKEPFPTVSR